MVETGVAPNPPSRRERQAQQTREEILQAARRLFAEHGYRRTTIRHIAEAAGVSSQTVYDSVGTKRRLVAALNDLIDTEAGIAAIAIAAAQSSDPIELVETPSRITRAILEHCGDIVHALVTGAADEPDLAVALTEGHQRHLAGATQITGLLSRLDALDPSLSPTQAAETLGAITDVQFALMLSDKHSWSLDKIESWMRATSRRLLLRTH